MERNETPRGFHRTAFSPQDNNNQQQQQPITNNHSHSTPNTSNSDAKIMMMQQPMDDPLFSFVNRRFEQQSHSNSSNSSSNNYNNISNPVDNNHPNHMMLGDLEPTPIRPGALISSTTTKTKSQASSRNLADVFSPSSAVLQDHNPRDSHAAVSFSSLPPPTCAPEAITTPLQQQQWSGAHNGTNNDPSSRQPSLVAARSQAMLSLHLQQQLSQQSPAALLSLQQPQQQIPEIMPDFVSASSLAVLPQHSLSSFQQQGPNITIPPFPITIPHPPGAGSGAAATPTTTTMRQRQQESSIQYLEPGDGPTDHDIVCARGRRFYHLPGSVRFRQIRDAFLPVYRSALTRFDKAEVISRMVEVIQLVPPAAAAPPQQQGRSNNNPRTTQLTRFLKYHTHRQVFSVMSPAAVRDKVGHALRSAAQEQERLATGSQSQRNSWNSLLMDDHSDGSSTRSSSGCWQWGSDDSLPSGSGQS